MQCLKLWALRFIGPDLGAAVVVQDGFAKFGIVFALALQSWYRTALLLVVCIIYIEPQNLFSDVGRRALFSSICILWCLRIRLTGLALRLQDPGLLASSIGASV